MSIGILYESDEWSNWRIKNLIESHGIKTNYIYIENFKLSGGKFPDRLYINRVFPSAGMRGNNKALKNTSGILEVLNNLKIPVINSFNAFLYDCSKVKTYDKLLGIKINIPEYYFIGDLKSINSFIKKISFPAVLKKDCGGRSFDLNIIRNAGDLQKLNIKIESDCWIIQEFIEPVKEFTTRVEIVDGKIMTVLKRYLGKGGVSSYSTASRYEVYNDCPLDIKEDSIKIMNFLEIEMGSIDFIETESGINYVIDVNATSNFTPDYIPLLGFDPVEKMVEYILKKYKIIQKGEK
ncbi:RimK family alpha-L-glutamate ligase [candidate division KSB1 bacterium]